jgi:diguanylate cyclase (GGDEF)-like protein
MHLIKKRKILINCLILTSIALSFIHSNLSTVSVPLLLGLSILVLFLPAKDNQKQQTKTIADENQKDHNNADFSRITQKHVNEEIASVHVSVLGSEHRKNKWHQIETTIDELLDNCIKIISSRMDAHTIAVFFPSKDGGYKLRRFSSRSEHVNPEAIIYPGVGVIGGFLKDGLKQLNLKEIVSDSITLYYYNRDAGIRSLMASPIIAGDIERGTLIVDSTNTKNFSEQDHAFLSTVASILGQAVFSTYLSTEHKLEHVRLAAMSNIEKEFFNNLKLDLILDKMAEIITFAIYCDRLTIAIKSEDGSHATILRAHGDGTEWFLNKEFSLKEKTLSSIVFSKNICISRNFSDEHYEIRYGIDEPQESKYKSFLAVPIGTDDCRGMILLESTRPDAFFESHKDLLSRIATSAALAIEKIIILEKAENMATHDGLTGLFNHRRFQQILKDEITRSIRYNDPLALVICDIDYFKKVNDTYGHQFGDTVLKGVAAKLGSSIREGIDTASRYGGEEFSLVLVKTDEKSTVETVERIRQQIAGMVFKGPAGQDVNVTMSFGIAYYRTHARQIDELIKKADKALYRAKENGRNRVEVF